MEACRLCGGLHSPPQLSRDSYQFWDTTHIAADVWTGLAGLCGGCVSQFSSYCRHRDLSRVTVNDLTAWLSDVLVRCARRAAADKPMVKCEVLTWASDAGAATGKTGDQCCHWADSKRGGHNVCGYHAKRPQHGVHFVDQTTGVEHISLPVDTLLAALVLKKRMSPEQLAALAAALL